MMTVVGLPKETKPGEGRVALTPDAASALVGDGHRVVVEVGAGAGAGFGDDEYAEAGASVVVTAQEAWAADLVVKVKEPQDAEFELLRPGQTLFTYLHLASSRPLTEALLQSGCTALGYETVEVNGRLPLLAPMSAIAGRVATQAGLGKLCASEGGRGIVPGGIVGVAPAHVVVIGAGVAGRHSVEVACGLGARVTVLDIDLERLESIRRSGLPAATIVSTPRTIHQSVAGADLVVGAVLRPGAPAPKVLDEASIASMLPGSVFVDLAIDQGGCSTTSRPTSHLDPTYRFSDVIHYAVTNVPGAVPRSSTQALVGRTIGSIRALAANGVAGAAKRMPELVGALNVADHAIAHPEVAATFPDLPALCDARSTPARD